MLIFYGLGNNEQKYLQTKHNAGRIVVEELAKNLDIEFSQAGNCMLAKKNDLWLIYSKGYMNTSGEPIRSLLNYYKIKTDNNNILLVTLQDDSDQIEINSKLSIGGGTAGHKGIDSIYQQLASLSISPKDIWRIKLGIRPAQNKLRSETFVLKSCSKIELDWYKEIASKIEANLKKFEDRDISKLQNVFNQKDKINN